MAGRCKKRFIPAISPTPLHVYDWIPSDDPTLYQTSFSAGGNTYALYAEREDVAPDIGEYLAGRFGGAPASEAWFVKFDNVLNAFWSTNEEPLDFKKTSLADVARGKKLMTRTGLNELFSHLAHATRQFMESMSLDSVFAVGDTEGLQTYYVGAFGGLRNRDIGLAVDEIDPSDVHLPYVSMLVLRTGGEL